VQTFLPYADFERSARSLDPCRLGKQRAECIQVVRGLTVPGYGWRHHPAVTMWRHRLEALGRYSLTCCEVWTETGRADTCAATLGEDLSTAGVARVRTQAELSRAGALPHWLGDPDFHRSHQSALLRKDPEHYGPLFPGRARRTCPTSGPRPLRLARGVRGTARSCLPTASTRPTTRSRMRPTTGHMEPSGPRWPPELGLGLGMPCRGAGLSTMSKSTRFRGGRSPTAPALGRPTRPHGEGGCSCWLDRHG
jgi:hypothetical protein